MKLPKLLFIRCQCRQNNASTGYKEAGTRSGSMDTAFGHGIRYGCIRQSNGQCEDSVEFKISGSVQRAVDSIPEGVELVVTVESVAAMYNLRGFFLANSDQIVGTVVSIGNDLGFQPVGTSGPFVLYQLRS